MSRDRERLADASAVQFTRNPNGLKGALLTIAGVPTSSRIESADAEEVAHMLFASGMQRWFATHPSLAERVQALDPSFNTDQLVQQAEHFLQSSRKEDEDDLLAESNQIEMLAERAPPAATVDIARVARIATPIDAGRVAQQVGNPLSLHFVEGRAQRLTLPLELRNFADSSGQAQALLLAQLISRDAGVRTLQLKLVGESLGKAECAAVEAALPLAARLGAWLRVPAVLQLFPGLRRLARTDRETLLTLIGKLIIAEGRIDVFEFCLGKLVSVSLRDELAARAQHGSGTLAAAAPDLGVLFAVLAQQGNDVEVDARRAYEAGISRVLPMDRPAYATITNWSGALDGALTRLQDLQPFAKRAVVEGLVVTIAHDDQLNVAEAELLRVVCAIFQCPLPPILPTALIDETLEFQPGEQK